MYEALRAYFVDDRPSTEVARAFGYTTGSFQVLCHHFRRDSDPVFFTSTRPGPRSQPKKSAARELIIELRKQNHSVYEISEALKQQNCPLSPTAVREVLREEGFAALPRRLDSERPDRPRPTIEPICRCPEPVSGSAHVHHTLWRFVLICSRFGAPEVGSIGSEHPYARIENDPGRTGLAQLSGPQTVVHRTAQPCHGAGRRRRLGIVCGTECLSKEKLLVGVFLPR